MAKSLGYCFTLNNYSDEEFSALMATDCQYVIIGKEVGESGTPHLQGFFQFSKPGKSLVGVKKINPKAHWETTKGNVDQNVAYCSKDGNFEERGIKPVSQKRKGELEVERYELARSAAKSGKFDDIPADIYIRHLGNLHKIHAEAQGAPIVMPGALPHQWIWGPAGVGKTSSVFAKYPDGIYIKDTNQWWDGYTDQEVVLIDDMDPFKKSLSREFKIWGDRYSFPAQIKGGTRVVRPKMIIVTSQYRIDEIWEDEVTRAAMHRRYTEIYMPSNEIITDNKYQS